MEVGIKGEGIKASIKGTVPLMLAKLLRRLYQHFSNGVMCADIKGTVP
jgi:hypothetical protein